MAVIYSIMPIYAGCFAEKNADGPQKHKRRGANMNKQDLVHKIAEDAGLTQKQAAAALDSALGAVVAAVSAGEKV